MRYNKQLIKKLKAKLKTVYNRGFSTGFYLGKPINQWTNKYGSKATVKKQYVGKVLNFYRKPSVAEIKIESNKLKLGDKIMFQGNKTGVVQQTITSLQINNIDVKQAKKGQRIGVKTIKKIRENDKIYKFSSKND